MITEVQMRSMNAGHAICELQEERAQRRVIQTDIQTEVEVGPGV